MRSTPDGSDDDDRDSSTGSEPKPQPKPQPDAISPYMQRLGTGPSHEGERMLARLAARMFGAEQAKHDRIGRFELRERIGAGAMGVVYEAWDPELDRRVAIKLLRERPGQLRDPNSGKRLLREAKAMARLRHPNVVQVHEVGTHEGQVFVAMEMIDGGSLRAWLGERARSWIEIVEVFRKAGRGLAAAHAADLVHRDFKPDNVLIEDGRVFVGDFGLARTQDPSESSARLESSLVAGSDHSAALTQTGAFVGTPAYMAPEAFCEGSPKPRGDQYSFCASLYEALYGVRPWPGETVSTLRAAKAEALTSVPKQGPQASKVPLWLRHVVIRGLAPAPEHRFESMDALLLALDRGVRRSRWLRRDLWIGLGVTGAVVGGALGLGAEIFGDEPAQSAPALCRDSPDRLAQIWNSKRRTRVTTALVASELPYATELATRSVAALDGFGQRWIHAHRSTCEATHVAGEQSGRALDLRMRCLDRRLGELDALLARFEQPTQEDVFNSVKAVNELTPVDACENLELLESTTPLPDDPQVRAQVEAIRKQLDAVNAAIGTNAPAKVEALARAQLEAAKALAYKPVIAEAGVALGLIASRTGKPKQAKPLLEQAIVDAQASGHDEFAARAMIAAIYVVGFRLRDFEGGERLVRQSQAMLEHIGRPARMRGSYLRNLAAFEFGRGNFEQARVHSQQAIEFYAALNGESHFSVAESRINLAAIERRLGKVDKALALYARAKADLEAILGPAHPSLFTPLNNIAAALMARGRDTEAEAALRQALSLAARSMSDQHSSIGHAHNNLGELLLGQGRYQEALESYDRAIETWTRLLGKDNLLLGHPLTGRGLALLELGDPKRARADLERAFAIRNSQGGSVAKVRKLGETEFILARVLDVLAEPRAEVTELARRAREHLGDEDGDLVTRAQIDAWLVAR